MLPEPKSWRFESAPASVGPVHPELTPYSETQTIDGCCIGDDPVRNIAACERSRFQTVFLKVPFEEIVGETTRLAVGFALQLRSNGGGERPDVQHFARQRVSKRDLVVAGCHKNVVTRHAVRPYHVRAEPRL